MPLVAVILSILVAATEAKVPDKPIVVTGHAWAPFISPMGEPFRAHAVSDDTFANWFYQADRNRDGVLTPDEMQADADRFFAKLDTNHDGEIDPDELVQYEWDVAPEIQVNSRHMRAPGEPRPKEEIKRASGNEAEAAGHGLDGRRGRGMDGGPQGAARYALLNIPEPVAAADTNFDRAISLSEFRQAAIARFQLLDTAHTGRLPLATLQAMLPKPGKKPKYREEDPDARIGNPLPPGN
jgi:Ca2+-binding EF-hand superfamily protein